MNKNDFQAPIEPKSPSWQPPGRGGVFGSVGRLILLLIVTALIVLPFTPMAGKIKRALNELAEKARTTRIVNREIIKRVEVRPPPPPPPPLPSKFVPRKEVDVTTLYNGISINTKVETSEGNYASFEVEEPEAYKVSFSLSVRVPKANQSVKELARINPNLPAMLPGLGDLVAHGKVSGFYHKLYENKITMVQRDLTRLNKLLDRHNMFDCETILELKDPKTSRKALLIQSEMDVVADGTDGDRAATLDDSIAGSDYYQPFTSYFWKKKTSVPNPLLARWQSKLNGATEELTKKGLNAERSRHLKIVTDQLKLEIEDMKVHSSLIADSDPFIVIPLQFKPYVGSNENAPQMGDLAVVIHDKQILPAICGDYGPTMKVGEASLFLAKQVNPKSTPYKRGEDALKVTYLIFPGTSKKPFGPPNLEQWRTLCMQYLNELGGIGNGFTLHTWEDKFKRPEIVAEPVPATFVGPPAPPHVAPTPAPVPTKDKAAEDGDTAADKKAAPPEKAPGKAGGKKKKSP